MGRIPATALGIPLVHREAVDPAITENRRICQLEAVAELDPQPAEDLSCDRSRVGDDKDEIARAGAYMCDQPFGENVAEELRDRAPDGAVFLDCQ